MVRLVVELLGDGIGQTSLEAAREKGRFEWRRPIKVIHGCGCRLHIEGEVERGGTCSVG